ncbi:MAG TPA: ABC transporter permease, partial [Polyangiaceae bacterium]|nr:ABC transporter permease [Polyangiaceae bacterium]
LSQWQLIGLRFRKHRLAVASIFALFVLYALAVFSEPIAPYAPYTRHLDYPYAPPQSLHFNLRQGLHTYALERYVDPITFRKQYVELPGEPLKIRFFARGETYRLWGVIPLQRRLFSVEQREIVTAQGTARAPSTFFLLGADRYGRDVFSRTVYGARISLSVGMIGVFFTFVLGLCLGGLSGYVGGRTDNVIQRGIEVVNAFPQLPLWIALSALLPGDWSALAIYFSITLMLSLLNWTGLARVVRGKILSLREEEYAVAARLIGASHSRVLFRHLLPGFTSHIIVALTLSVPGVILGETALSFLGLGLRPPIVSWGVMLQDCMDVKAVRYYPWLLTPVLFIVGTVLSFNFLGDGVRDAADPYG